MGMGFHSEFIVTGEIQIEVEGSVRDNVSWGSIGLEFALDHPQVPSVFRALWD